MVSCPQQEISRLSLEVFCGQEENSWFCQLCKISFRTTTTMFDWWYVSVAVTSPLGGNVFHCGLLESQSCRSYFATLSRWIYFNTCRSLPDFLLIATQGLACWDLLDQYVLTLILWGHPALNLFPALTYQLRPSEVVNELNSWIRCIGKL